MKEIIAQLVMRLGTAPTIKYSDEDWGQLDMPKPAVKWPCSLVSIYDGVLSNTGQDRTKIPVNRQEGTITVNLRFANLRLSNSSANAPAAQRANTLTIHDVVEEAHTLIHGWSPGGKIGKFIRSRINYQKRDDGVQEYIVQYTVAVFDF